MKLVTGKKYNLLCRNSCERVLSWPKRVGVMLCVCFIFLLSNVVNAQTATISGSATVCQGATQPIITFAWTGGEPSPYTFTYSINDVTQPAITTSNTSVTINAPTNVAGSFIYKLISAKDGNNITIPGSGTATVTVNEPPTISTQPQSATTGIGCNTSFSVTASGSGTLSYQWRKNGSNILGATSSTYSISPVAATDAASYDVVVTNSCGNVTSSAASLNVNPALAAGSHNTDAVTACSNFNPAALTVAGTSGGVLPYSYQWLENGNPVGTNSDSYDPANLLTPGTYSISVRITDACGKQVITSPKTITIVADPSVTISGGSSFCIGSSATLTANVTNGTGTIGYQWQSSPDGAAWTSIPGAILQSYSPSTSTAGAFYYKVLVTVNGSACNNATATQTITVNPTPTATAPGNQTYCNGVATTAIPLTGTPSGVVFDISGGAAIGLANQTGVTSIPSFTPITGSATITIIPRANGCTGASVSYNVTVNPSLPVSVSIASNDADNIICAGQSVTFTATPTNGGTSPVYQWRINGLNVGGPTSSNTFTTSTLTNGQVVSVALTSNATPCATGNPATSSFISMTVNPIPSAPVAGNGGAVCVGGTISLTASTIAGATYSWTGPNSFTSALQNPTIANATTGMAGTYSVTVTVNGCTSPGATTNVTVNPIPATPTASSNSPVCTGTSINLSTPSVAGATYAWTGPNGFTINQQNPTINNATTAMAGMYNVTITVNGCTSAAGTTDVVVNSAPATPTASSPAVCAGATINLSTPAVAGATYAWTGPNGFTSALQNPTINNATTAMAGMYNVTITVNGCTSAAGTTDVVVNSAPATPTASSPAVCAGATINLSTPAVAGATYAWTGPNGFTSALQNPTIANATAAMAGTYNVTVTVNGCTSAQGSTTLTVNPIPATPTASSPAVCAGATINLSTPAVAGATYAWTGLNGFTSALQNPTIANATAAMAGTYNVTVTVNGCTSAQGSTTLTVNPIPTITGTTPASRCNTGTVILGATASAGTINWYANPTGGPSLGTGTSFTTPSISSTTTYYVDATANGCTSATRTAVIATITNTPSITSTTPGSFCASGTPNTTLTATASGGTINWYNQAVGGTLVGTGTSFTTPNLGATTSYYVEAILNGCASARTQVIATRYSGSPTNSGGPAANRQISGTSSICPGPAATGITFSIPVSLANYETLTWSVPSGFTITSGAGTGTITVSVPGAGSVPGNNIITLTASNPCGNITVTKAVTISSFNAINAGADFAMCIGNNPTLTNTLSGGASRVTWTTTTGTISGGPYPTPFTYTPPAGFTGTVTLTANTDTAAGSCSAASSFGSDQVIITVNQPPAITVQPISPGTLCSGSPMNLSVTATGTGLTYQWKKGGVNISGATSSTYSIPSIATADAGDYTVVVSGASPCAPVTSSTATLVVNQAPTISVQPTATQTLCSGSNVTFSVTATGTGLTYQWKKGGTDIPGANSSTYTINNITTADAATYTVVVTGTAPCGSATSQNAVLNVNQVVAITAQPTGATLCSGSAANFSVTATGTGLTYKWKKNGTDIPGATSASYSIPSVSASDAGTYTVEVSGAAPCSPVTSQNAVLVVNQAPAITAQPTGATLCSGSAANFSVTATGTGLTYQWKKDGANISGATSSTYSIPNVTTGDAGDYTVEISGVSPCTPVTSLPAKLVVNQVVSITTQPVANQALCAGSGATFSVTATGTGLSYQWKKNGSNISGATASTYSISSVTTGDAGTYTVEVSGTAPCLPVTSQNSVLTVSDPVVIQVQPAPSQTVCSGFPASFSVTATGTGLMYQWKRDGVDIAGATSATYSIPNTTTSHSGTYTVVVSGTAPCTPVPSQNAVLVVNQDIAITAQPTATQTLCEGTTATISVTATGNIASYVWRKGGIPVSDGGNISGATTATLTITGITTANAGSYDVVISGAGGACAQTISTPAVVNVNRHSTISLSSATGTDAQRKCINSALNPITYAIGGGGTGASITAGALPAGVTGSYNNGVFTISGTPTASGSFNYTITTQGPCNNVSVTGTITVDENSTLSLSSANATQPVCINTALNNIVYAVGGGATNAIATGLPTGVNGTYNAGVFTISGTPTVSGTFNYSVTTEGPCVNPTLTGTITVNQVSTISLSSAFGTDGQEKCIGNAITPITYAVGGGATGVNLTGTLPNGVTGSFNNGVYTISGTPTAAGTFNYTLTTTGPCSNVSVNGTVKINDNSTISLSSGTGTNDQTKCINTAITNITYAIGGGATNAIVSGLPAGVNASYNNGVLTISGMPTVAGTFNYTVTTQGPCNNPTATGKITVGGNSTLTLTSASADQNLCINSVPTNITYAVGGTATGATVTGLPAGMIGSYSNGVFTISNTPTIAGVFNYTVTTTGSCANPSLGGKITVDPAPAGGTLSPSVITACGTPASGTITLSGYSGTIKRWESSTNGGGTWTPISNTSASFNYSNVSQTTLYRAVIESGTCPLAYSTNSVVSVVPPTTPTATSSPTQICVGQTVNLAATSGLQQSWADIDATFNQANPAGWRIKENGVEINFPAQANNASTFPWSETNGPKQPFGGGVIYNNFPRPPLGNDKFAIASGIVNTTMETPIFSTVGMTAATLQFYQALVFAAGASGKIEISTDGGNTYNNTLVQYDGPLTIGNPSSNWTPLNIDLSNYVGLSNLRIRFTYNGADNSNWALDGLNLQPPGPVVTYNWTLTNPSGVASPYYLNATNQQNVTATPPAAGTYTYQVTTMINGCPGGTNNVTVTVNPLPTVTVNSSTICAGGTATVTATPGAAGTYSYAWTVPAGVTNPGNVASFTTTVASTYSVVIRNTATNCSSASASGLVTINTVTPGSVAGDQSICTEGDPAAFTVSTAATGRGALTYQWQKSTTDCTSGFSDISGATSATYDAPTGLTVKTYYRRIVTSILNGVQCTATSNCITVSINPVMTMGACSKTNTTSYGSSTGSVTAGTITNSVGTVKYSWKNANGDVVGTTATVNNLPAGTYTLTVSDDCTTLTCQVTISEAALNATIGVNATVCEGDASPNITFTNSESVPVRITYNINGGGNLTIDVGANATATVQAPTGTPGTFQYNLVSIAPQAAPGSSNSITGSATVIVKPKPVLTNIYHN